MLNKEDQKFMALEGLHTWGSAVLLHVDRLRMIIPIMTIENFIQNRRASEIECVEFLIAAYRLVRFIKWAKALDFIESGVFDEYLLFEEALTDLRHKNEHVEDYYRGKGQKPATWEYESSDCGKCDASASFESKIGGRLDWNEVAEAVADMLARLPPHYFPKQE